MANTASPKRQPLIEHIHELRRRLFWTVIALLIGSVIGYQFNDIIQEILVRPLNQQLFYTSPTGGFDFIFRISIFFGFLLSVPVLAYQIIKFFEPLLPHTSKMFIIKFLFTSFFLMLAGVSFGYFISLPATLHFLSNFTSDQITSLITAHEYLSFVTLYLSAFGLIFQLPLIIFVINRIKPLKPGGLMKSQRYVLVGSFVSAALITPTPDPLNQTIMALPIIVLYQASIAVVWLANRKRNKQTKQIAHDLATPETYVPPVKPQTLQPSPMQPLRPYRHAAAVLDLRPKEPLSGNSYPAEAYSSNQPQVLVPPSDMRRAAVPVYQPHILDLQPKVQVNQASNLHSTRLVPVSPSHVLDLRSLKDRAQPEKPDYFEHNLLNLSSGEAI